MECHNGPGPVQYRGRAGIDDGGRVMGVGQNGAVLRQVGRLFGSGTVAGLSEDQLIDRFVRRRDESAFEAIVARHGPMVLGVCRRALPDPNDADDAFQATFLVLVKKAGTLRDRALLGSWLHGVAHRVAARSRSKAARRRAVEGAEAGPAVEAEARPERPGVDADLMAIVDAEIARLPERDRAAIVLCDLEGFPGEEAARRLGVRAVTLRSRLLRARRRLKDRLVRRGVAGSVALGLALPTASPPPALAAATIRAAIGFATNPATAGPGIVPASVLALTQGVLGTMTLTKIKTLAATMLSLGLVVAVAGVRGQDPTPPPENQGDRLREVERKLDRLLEAVARPGRTEPADPFRKMATPEEAPRAEVRKTVLDPTVRQSDRKTPVASSRPPVDLPALPSTTLESSRETTTDGDRLTRLEQKFAELERRIARLEDAARTTTMKTVVPAAGGSALSRDRPRYETTEMKTVVPTPTRSTTTTTETKTSPDLPK